jgi:hypothetical protein
MFKPSDFIILLERGVSGRYVLVAFSGSSLKLEISGFEEIRKKLKTSFFVDDLDVPTEMTSSEVLAILVPRFLGFLGQLPSRQNGPRNNIVPMDQYFVNTGWHVEPQVFYNK